MSRSNCSGGRIAWAPTVRDISCLARVAKHHAIPVTTEANAAMPVPLNHDRIYGEVDRHGQDGHERGVLRVSVSIHWGARPKIHIREWNRTARDPALLVPGRGIALSVEELDAMM